MEAGGGENDYTGDSQAANRKCTTHTRRTRVRTQVPVGLPWPGLRAFSANVGRDKNEEQEIPHPMVKSAARFGAPKIELWPF